MIPDPFLGALISHRYEGRIVLRAFGGGDVRRQ